MGAVYFSTAPSGITATQKLPKTLLFGWQKPLSAKKRAWPLGAEEECISDHPSHCGPFKSSPLGSSNISVLLQQISMAMTLIRERGDAEGAHAQSGCWSLACSPQLLQGSGTQGRTKIRYWASWSLGCIWSPWRVTAVVCASGFVCARGLCSSCLIPLLCEERAGSKLLIFHCFSLFQAGKTA